MLKRKICVVTGTRAEYGLLRFVIEHIQKSEQLQLQLIATGMHLSPEFGLTIQEILDDSYVVNRKVETLLSSDTPVGVTKSIGLGLIGFADAFAELNPDLLLVLGDRYEIFAAASAALIARIPIAHIHGGELTEGAFDDAIRHSITKMSCLHFVAADEYRRRVIQLGESPNRVFNVGGLGVDAMLRIQLMSLSELEKSLSFQFSSSNFLITYHPETLDDQGSICHVENLLEALAAFPDIGLIFTLPNADTDGRIITNKIKSFCRDRPNAKSFISLGQLRYFSCIKHVTAVVGNSSSGLTEVPSFKKPTVNIGDRQRGRLKAESVIDCEVSVNSICSALSYALSPDFLNKASTSVNPYGNGGASEHIVRSIENCFSSNLSKKTFNDIDFVSN